MGHVPPQGYGGPGGASVSISIQLRALIIGIIGGSFGGLVGLGGGVVMVPLFTMWAGLSQHEAHGTSLAAVIVTGTVGAWLYGNHGHVLWASAGWLAAASVVASFFTAQYAARISGARLRVFFGVFLLIAAVMLLVRDHLPLTDVGRGQPAVWILLAIGAFAGAIAGLMGVGGGVLVVPLLVLAAGVGQHLAQGTSLAAMILTGVTATAVYARHGHFRKDIILALLPGVVAGSWIGSHSAIDIPGSTLRVLFALILIWLGGRYAGLTSALWSLRTSGGVKHPAPLPHK
jgi:uncharacterized membrane protein YfcA